MKANKKLIIQLFLLLKVKKKGFKYINSKNLDSINSL